MSEFESRPKPSLRAWIPVGAALALFCVLTLGFGLSAAIFGSGHRLTNASAQPSAVASKPQDDGANKLALAIGYRMGSGAAASTTLAIEERASSVETQDDWGTQLRESKYFERLKKNRSATWRNDSGGSQRYGLIKAEPEAPPATLGFRGSIFGYGVLRGRDSDDVGASFGSGTYRTMCVRTCDGFYWPISFSTTKESFEKDQDTCERSCGGAKQAKLFVYRNPGEQTEDMEDLNGKPYKQMSSAFLFRASYNESCKCRPHPWEDASLDLHRSYAKEAELQTQADKGDKKARTELRAIRKKIQSSLDGSTDGDKKETRVENSRPTIR